MIIVRARHYLTGDVCDVHVHGDTIQAVGAPVPTARVLGGDGHWLTPGLLDLQVNGCHGHDFTSPDLTVAHVAAVAHRLAHWGVTGFCPTVITAPLDILASSLRCLARACEDDETVRTRILGIHLEGPYISAEDGPRGAHPRAHVRLPDWDEFLRLQEAARGRIRLITLAPELPGALPFIEKLAASGVVVSLGHHAASREQINAAVLAGATMCTHLGNGCHSQLPRHPNHIWEQLAHDGLAASIIADGHHLPPSVVKSFWRAKGADRLVLVSDVVSAAGLPLGSYTLMGLDIEVWADGSVHATGTPYLAGSTLALCDAVANLMRFAGASFAQAVTAATVNPARVLGLEKERGLLRIGGRADLVVFSMRHGRPEVAATIAGGLMEPRTDTDPL